jgi:hypothetical protein
MTSKKQGHGKAMIAKEMIVTAIVLIALVAFVSSAPLALAAELTIEPWDDITPGTPVTITGTGFDSNETVTIRTAVTCWKPVSDGYCECTMSEFEIPANTSFKLSVWKVEDNVTLYIKKLIWVEINPGLTSFFTFEYDPATYTSNVSHSGKILPLFAGIYSIDVIGDAKDDEENCTMSTTAELEVPADADGNFSLDVNTQGIPICNFTINATGQTSKESDEKPLNLFVLGDPSKDGQVSAYDCVAIARYWAGITGYDNSTICYSAAAGLAPDCNLVTLDDARCLAEHLIGMHGIPCSGCP